MAEEGSRFLDESAVPVTVVWDRMLMLPIVGVLDSRRVQEIMESVLNKISETQARVLILDILGVSVMDSAVANHVIKITKAARLMGCTCIITGVTPEIAQTIVNLGIDLGEVVTQSTLRDGLEAGFRMLGLEVVEAGGHVLG